jgi:protocatechuate 3,4-dioxygenase beta subunit
MRKKIAYRMIGVLLIAAVAYVLSQVGGSDTSDEDAPSQTTPASEHAREATVDAPPGSVLGQVTRSDGQPIAAAIVTATLQTEDGPGEVNETSADEAGNFRFEKLAPGTYLLDASAKGHVSPGPVAVRGKSIEIPSADAPPMTGVELTLPRVASIAGKITASGKPVAGARLSLYYLHADGLSGPLEPFALDAVATSSPDGNFTIAEVAPGRLRVLVEADGWALAESREVFLIEDEKLTDLDVDLAPSGTLSISVLDPQGDPVRADVVLSGGELRARRKRTSQDGKLILSGIPVGEVRLDATSDGFENEQVIAKITAGKVTDVDVIMERAGGLMGEVLDKQGKPVANVPVEIVDDQDRKRIFRTNGNGFFQFDPGNSDATRWLATAISPYHAPSKAVSLLPGERARLVLGGSGKIRGRVITRAGKPVQEYRIAVEDFEVDGPRYHNQRTWGAPSVNRSDGVFEFGPVQPGDYFLRVEPFAFAGAVSDRITVREGSITDNITIVVDEAGSVVGVVRDATTNKPLASATVEVFEPQSPFPKRSTMTDEAGRYKLEGISPGRRSVRVSMRGYMTEVAAGVEVPPAGERTRDIALEKSSPEARFSFHGIGATLEKTDKGVTIRDTMEGSPSETFGLKAGDTILGIDGEDASDMRLVEVVNRIRGEEGVPVSLVVEREGEGRIEIDVERGRVVVKDRQ